MDLGGFQQLVHDHDLAAVDGVQETAQAPFTPVLSRGIVGVAQENHFGPGIDGRQHALIVEAEVLQTHQSGLDA